MPKTKSDPKLYIWLTQNVYADKEAVDDALDKFFDELYELRKKYRIPDLHVITMVPYQTDKGIEKKINGNHIGYGLMAGPMLLAAIHEHMKDMAEVIEEFMKKEVAQ